VTTHSGPLGTYLADAQGRTLYLFTTDSMGSSACSGSCATAWPPLVTTGSPTTTGGANASLVGTITRGDGSVQVTYKGHPLYRFASDARAGDLKGQGVGQKWYLVSPAGDMIRANAPATKTTGGAGTGWS
jgi:predicted lipoprotein with Yx(FWY)xxD motif